MEGILHKWTNYWNGWQPRWFILEDGVLSYYQSEQEVSKGCKGSLKVSACDISVHGTDLTRLDLVIPSEQHYCLRAASTKERQQWLLALGAAKQTSGGNSRSCRQLSGGGSTDSLRSKRSELRLYCDLLMQQAHQLKSVASSRDPGPCIAELDEVGSNLSVTCDTFIRALDDCMSLVNESLVTGQLSPSHQPVTVLHHQRHREKRVSVTNSGVTDSSTHK